MDELMDLMVNGDSPSQVSDKIKEILFTKSAETLDRIRPEVAASVFDGDEVGVVSDDSPEYDTEEPQE